MVHKGFIFFIVTLVLAAASLHAYPKGAPVNQWGELNHSKRWSSFFLWKDGTRQDAACALCPKTAALLEA